MGALRGRGARQRVVRHRRRRQGHQDMGPRQRETQGVAHRTRQHRQRSGGVVAAPLPVQLRRGQAGQVLGPGIQQGDPALPRAPVGRVRAGAAPHHRRAGVGGARRHGARVGRAHQGQRAHAGRPHGHDRLAALPGRRAAGGDGLARRHRAPVGPGRRQVALHAHQPQEVGAGTGAAPGPVRLRVRLARQHQAVALPRRPLRPEPVRPQRHRQLPGGDGGRRAGQRRRQRLAAPVGLAHRVQLPAPAVRRAAGLHGLGGRRLRHGLRPLRLAPAHGRGRQDRQDLPRGRDGQRGDAPCQLAPRRHQEEEVLGASSPDNKPF